jgi:hypothetical protein
MVQATGTSPPGPVPSLEVVTPPSEAATDAVVTLLGWGVAATDVPSLDSTSVAMPPGGEHAPGTVSQCNNAAPVGVTVLADDAALCGPVAAAL